MTSEIERKMKLEALRKIRKLEEEARSRLSKIKYKIAIISGKGGVGKSFITANLGSYLAYYHHKKVGILDADIHGPSIPKLLGGHGLTAYYGPNGIVPISAPGGVRVISLDFMLPSEETPLIWRGPLKTNAIRELLAKVDWGSLDYLLVDLPPGTGDEALTVVQLIKDLDGVIIVTIPSDLSRIVVKKAVTFARKLDLKILGIIENMSRFVCPNCGQIYRLLGGGGGKKLAEEMNIDFLGEIPLDPRVEDALNLGKPFVMAFPESLVVKSFKLIVQRIEEKLTS